MWNKLSLFLRNAKSERRKAAALPRGMTLIEIMVVLVILGLIAGAIGFNVFSQLKEAQIKTARTDLRGVEQGIELFKVDTGNLPDNLQALAPKYLKELRKDPWGQDYKYTRASNESYDIYSYGPDKAQGGGDDIVLHGGSDGATKASQ